MALPTRGACAPAARRCAHQAMEAEQMLAEAAALVVARTADDRLRECWRWSRHWNESVYESYTD
eukprot:4455030-Pleurochrysis_carterae.AAC.1